MPLFLVGTSGYAAASFRDLPGTSLGTLDLADLGAVDPLGPAFGVGIGTGGTFANGSTLPIGASCCATGADIVWSPAAARGARQRVPAHVRHGPRSGRCSRLLRRQRADDERSRRVRPAARRRRPRTEDRRRVQHRARRRRAHVRRRRFGNDSGQRGALRLGIHGGEPPAVEPSRGCRNPRRQDPAARRHRRLGEARRQLLPDRERGRELRRRGLLCGGRRRRRRLRSATTARPSPTARTSPASRTSATRPTRTATASAMPATTVGSSRTPAWLRTTSP